MTEMSILGDSMTLERLSAGYSFILCDIWGVLHNGETVFAAAIDALRNARHRGLPVVLVTNAPRTAQAVEADLAEIGIDRDAWDRVVTSGDVTRARLAAIPGGAVFHVGPERHWPLYDGLGVRLVAEEEATVVVCTGLFNELTDHPSDYAELLARLRTREIPLICANPDVSVMRGTRKIWCAGAIATDYTACGGDVEMIGKPFAPIYETALKVAQEVAGAPLRLKDGLAIGDGVHTDVKGAQRNGMDVLFIAGGLHAHECGNSDGIDPERLPHFLRSHRVEPSAVLYRLR